MRTNKTTASILIKLFNTIKMPLLSPPLTRTTVNLSVHKIKANFLFLFFMFLISCNSQTDIRVDKINKILEDLYQHEHFNGNILIAEKGEIIYEKSFGDANFEKGEKLTPSSIFNVASVSKTFTALSIMMLEEDGLLNLKDDVKQYYADFPYENITLENLLTHTSGLPRIQSQPFRKEIEGKGYSNDEIKDILFKIVPKQHFESGTNYFYANTNYLLSALIIEKVSKQPFDDFLVSRILKKTNMRQTFLLKRRVPEKMKKNLISYYTKPFWLSKNFKDVTNSKRRISDELTFANNYGASDIHTTTRDLLKFHTALQNGDLLKKESLQKMYAYYYLKNHKEYTVNSKSNYPSYRGLAWCISKDDPNIVYHSGGSIGGRSFIIRNIEKDQCIIILTNNQEMDRYNFTFPMKVLNQQEYQLDPISLPREFCNEYLKNGIDKAISFYRNKINVPNYKQFVDFDFEEIGNELVNRKDIKAAIEVYKLYTEAFSDEFSWELLGNTFMLDNNLPEAKRCLEKSLEISPEYKSALKSLKRLNDN